MTLEYLNEQCKEKKDIVRLVECPFCGADLRDRQVPAHLRNECDHNV